AHVTTPSTPPCSAMTCLTAASTAAVSAMSTTTSAPSARSNPTGVPPALRTASTTDAPSPDCDPVTITTPSGRSAGMRQHLLDETSGGPPLQERQQDDLPAPRGDEW